MNNRNSKIVRKIFTTLERLNTTLLSIMVHYNYEVQLSGIKEVTFEKSMDGAPRIIAASLGTFDLDAKTHDFIVQFDNDAAYSILDFTCGGDGTGKPKDERDFTDIEISILEGLFVRLYGNIREAFDFYKNIRPRLSNIETIKEDIIDIPDEMMMYEATYSITNGGMISKMRILLPFSIFEEQPEKDEIDSGRKTQIDDDCFAKFASLIKQKEESKEIEIPAPANNEVEPEAEADEEMIRYFDVLIKSNNSTAYARMRKETPQTIALILSAMENQEKAASILQLFNDGSRTEILDKIVRMRPVGSYIVREIERVIERSLACSFHDEMITFNGSKTAADIRAILEKNISNANG